MSDLRTRVALQPGVEQDALDALAWDNDWIWQQEVERGDQNPYELIWTTEDEQTQIHYIDDFLLNVPYVLALGPAAEDIAAQVRTALPTYRWDAVQTLFTAAQTPAQQVQALHYAAIVAAPPDGAAVVALFDQAASSPVDEVREAVILAIGYLGWPDLLPILERVQQSDPLPRVRQSAARMLEGLRLHPAS